MSSGSRLQDLRFRTSDRFELVLHDRLRPEEKRRFKPLLTDPDHWGVLRPRGPGSYRAIDRDTALLLFTLREAGPLPAYVVEDSGDLDPSGIAPSIRAMVLDGILDAETADGRPIDLLDEATDEVIDLESRSLAALRYGAALTELGVDDVRDLSIRLYLYGGEPLRRCVCDGLATRRDVLKYLGLAPGGSVRRCIPAGWRVNDRPERDWIFFRRRETQEAEALSTGSRGRCKLYVGCAFADVPRVFEAVVATLGGSMARSMKVGSSAIDLFRVDKIVVYFEAFEDLQRYASGLAERLEQLGLTEGAARFAVPFAAVAGARGLLSWGVDPPREAIPIQGAFNESWRAWLASRVAAALIATREASQDEDRRLRAVLERVRLDGVDVSRWTPDSRLWNEAP